MIKIQFRRDTGANWTLNNPILALGEMGLETDTGRFKLGDGVSEWDALVYASGVPGVSISSIAKTSGTGAAGSTDTYTITLSNGNTSTFNVYNGADGVDGNSAFQSAVNNGFEGTEVEWLASLPDGKVDLSTPQTITGAKRGAMATDNDLSFDLSLSNNFICTPSANGQLTFTGLAAGQSGNIVFINSAGRIITKNALVKASSTFLTTISTAGTYWLSYICDGTNVYVSASRALA